MLFEVTFVVVILKLRCITKLVSAVGAGTSKQLCNSQTPIRCRVLIRPNVVVVVEDGTVCKWQSVVIIHGGLWRTLLWPSFEAALLQRALQGQAGLLCWHSATENLQARGLDPSSVLDHTHQTKNCAVAQ